MNVKRLAKDSVNPGVFRKRIAKWANRVKKAGAVEWRTFMDATKLPAYLTEVRDA